ncbi:MAG: acetyl-coenzyme A synthetase N-terminal domain-containing protein, partial [Thermoleophilia bacterium]
MSEHLWTPDAKTIDQAQSTALARHLGVETYEDVLALALAEPERFWDETTRWLELGWQTPWTTVLDTSAGLPWATWFGGGRLNLAWSCV